MTIIFLLVFYSIGKDPIVKLAYSTKQACNIERAERRIGYWDVKKLSVQDGHFGVNDTFLLPIDLVCEK